MLLPAAALHSSHQPCDLRRQVTHFSFKINFFEKIMSSMKMYNVLCTVLDLLLNFEMKRYASSVDNIYGTI